MTFYERGDYVATLTSHEPADGPPATRLGRAIVIATPRPGQIEYAAWNAEYSVGYESWFSDVDEDGYGLDNTVMPLADVDDELLGQFRPLKPGDWPDHDDLLILESEDATAEDVNAVEAEIERLRNADVRW